VHARAVPECSNCTNTLVPIVNYCAVLILSFSLAFYSDFAVTIFVAEIFGLFLFSYFALWEMISIYFAFVFPTVAVDAFSENVAVCAMDIHFVADQNVVVGMAEIRYYFD